MIKRILVDLDVLLDTRLGVIRYIDAEAASYVVSNNEYWLRENDDWFKLTNGRITNEQFKEVYAKRGEYSSEILNASVLSNIIPFLMRVLAEDNINRLDNMGNPDDEVGITVNYWPYDLPGETIEELKDIVREYYGNIPVEVVSYSLETLEPKFLDALCSMYLTYSMHDWLYTHYLALSKVLMPDFNFIGPKLFEKDVSQLTIDQKKFELFKFKLERQVYMDFDFIDAQYFSMFKP